MCAHAHAHKRGWISEYLCAIDRTAKVNGLRLDEMLCLRALLLTACCLAPAALGLIHNLDSHPESEQIQPLAIEISPEEESGHDLQRIARDVLGQNYFA